MMPFVLAAAGLVLDAPRKHDVDDIVRYCADPVFESFMSTPWPYLPEHAHGFIDVVVPLGWNTGTEFTWAVRTVPNSPIVGMIGLRNDSESRSNIGFWIGTDHRKRGYASEAVRLVCDWAFTAGREVVGWECFVGNTGSAAVARRAGFRFTGTAPSTLAARDGSHPLAWHGELERGATHEPRGEWPL